MVLKDELLKSILRECGICRHLYTKFTPEGFEYRPSEAQRSTLELLRYVAIIGVAALEAAKRGDWSGFGELKARTESMTAEDFPAVMERHEEEIRDIFAALTEEDFHSRTMKMPWGEELSLGAGLMESAAKWMAAYRMQLFLYAKAAGATDLGTPNNWVGRDVPRRQPVPAEN